LIAFRADAGPFFTGLSFSSRPYSLFFVLFLRRVAAFFMFPVTMVSPIVVIFYLADHGGLPAHYVRALDRVLFLTDPFRPPLSYLFFPLFLPSFVFRLSLFPVTH